MILWQKKWNEMVNKMEVRMRCVKLYWELIYRRMQFVRKTAKNKRPIPIIIVNGVELAGRLMICCKTKICFITTQTKYIHTNKRQIDGMKDIDPNKKCFVTTYGSCSELFNCWSGRILVGDTLCLRKHEHWDLTKFVDRHTFLAKNIFYDGLGLKRDCPLQQGWISPLNE